MEVFGKLDMFLRKKCNRVADLGQGQVQDKDQGHLVDQNHVLDLDLIRGQEVGLGQQVGLGQGVDHGREVGQIPGQGRDLPLGHQGQGQGHTQVTAQTHDLDACQVQMQDHLVQTLSTNHHIPPRKVCLPPEGASR